MSHAEQLGFFTAIQSCNREIIAAGRVIEIGSYDVNGTMRSIIDSAEHVGVDLIAGPGVDIVEYGHRVRLEDGSFDAALSAECFEHDPHYRKTVTNMARLVRPGGLVAFSCGGRGRLEHGTQRTDPLHSPGTQAKHEDHYKNLSSRSFNKRWLQDTFDSWQFIYQSGNLDLYFAGIKKTSLGEDRPTAKLLTQPEIRRLQGISGAKKRLLTAPMRFASLAIPEPHFQSFALRYWRLINAIRR